MELLWIQKSPEAIQVEPNLKAVQPRLLSLHPQPPACIDSQCQETPSRQTPTRIGTCCGVRANPGAPNTPK